MDAYQHAARGLLADEVSSAAAIGLVNVSVEESFQVNEDAFHDRIIKEVTADESHELVAAFSMTVMLTILLLVIILGATIKHYNITWLHQSGAALLLGTIVGFVVWYVRRDPMYQDDGQAMLSSTLFVVMFTVLLMGGSTTNVLQKLGIIDHAPRFGPGGLNSTSGTRGSKGERSGKVDPGGLGKGMANIAGNNPMSPPRPSNKAHTKGSAPGTPGHVTAEHAPLLSESEQAADRRERRHRRGGAYRALRQFDFKYLQPLLLATPMKRLPREERPGRGGKGSGGGDGSSSRPGRHSPGYGSGGSSGGGSPERPEGKYSGMSRDASHGDLPDEVFANHSKQQTGSIGSRRATEAEQSYRVFQARDTRVNADGTPMWGTDEV